MKIFIYGTIGSSLFGPAVSAAEVIAQLEQDEDEPVALYINSGGGDVFDGIAIYNALKRHNGRVTVYVDGLAASAASVIAMAGDEVVMPANTMMMVHNPWTVAMGGASDMRKTADILDQTRDAIVSAYKDKTGLSENDLEALLDDETWFSAQAAVDWGFANRVEAPLEEDIAAKAFASLDYSRFKQVPGSIAAMAQRATPTAANAAAHPKGEDMADKQQAAKQDRPEIDVDALRVEAMKAERERSAAILAEANRVGLRRDTIDAIVEKGMTVEASRALIIDAIASQQAETRPVISGVAGTVKDQSEKWVEGVTQALSARAGLEKTDGKNPFRAMTLMELGKEDLRRRGIEANGNRLDIAAAIFASAGAANHNTGDFPNILKDVAHKAMLMGWEEAEETFDRWTRAGSLPDFKENSRVGLNGFPSLREVAEGAEYKYVTFGDTGETLKLKTYGELFAITRQALINDDLSAMTRLPQNMGRAARATIGDAVYDILKANTQVITETGEVLFHSGSHANTGTNILSETGLTLAATVMRKQKGPGAEGRTLNLRPAFLIVPAALEFKARQLMNSSVKIGGTNNEPNVVANLAEVIVDARLDATPTVGATQYFLAASPNVIDTIEVGYLDGVQSPFLDQQDGWGVDGTEFKVRIDFIARALGYRGLYRQTGASGS